MNEIRILGIYISNRVKDATLVQKVLTHYGCSIKTRLGLHEVVDNYCAGSGIVLLELTGDYVEMNRLEDELRKLDGIEVQKMNFKKQ